MDDEGEHVYDIPLENVSFKQSNFYIFLEAVPPPGVKSLFIYFIVNISAQT